MQEYENIVKKTIYLQKQDVSHGLQINYFYLVELFS